VAKMIITNWLYHLVFFMDGKKESGTEDLDRGQAK
jgi:hypothetical protein